jgi:hypothetical protein
MLEMKFIGTAPLRFRARGSFARCSLGFATAHRLQVSIVETRRADGKIHHEHVASLGSIETRQGSIGLLGTAANRASD